MTISALRSLVVVRLGCRTTSAPIHASCRHVNGNASRVAVLLLERRRRARQVQLRQQQELRLGCHRADPRHALGESRERGVWVAEHRRRLQRDDGERPHRRRQSPMASWNALVIFCPCAPPSTGSKVQLAVYFWLGNISWLAASFGSRLRRI